MKANAVMIEMRWLEWQQGWDDFDQNYWAIKRVLQYRVLDESVTWHGKAGAIRKRGWSEWQDVPTVKE